MCTLTWRARQKPSGYEIWFNRDEKIDRAAELPPRLWEGEPSPDNARGQSFWAPVDGARGGTWLAVNEAGLTVALLNDYEVAWRPTGPERSRGDVVVEAARSDSIDKVSTLLTREALAATGAFTLVVLSVDAGAAYWTWDGRRVVENRGAAVPSFFSSSSFRTKEVIAGRRAQFEREARAGLAGQGESTAMAYHLSHDATRGAESVLMCRPDANTRSVCRVRADESGAELFYTQVTRAADGPTLGQTLRYRVGGGAGMRANRA